MAETKYGKYFFSGSTRVDDGEHGVTLAAVEQDQMKGCYGLIMSWLPPKETPYMPHPAHIHSASEFLIHLGTNKDDPFDLGAEIELYMGKELERHTITRPTAVYIPPGFIHCPWTIKRVDRPWIFVQVSHGPRGGREYPQLVPKGDDKETAETKYGKYIFSGSTRVDDGEHGVTLAVIGDKTFPGCYGLGISWLPPKETPYRFHPPHIHPSAEYLIHIGTNPDDPFDLGAEIELCMGKEMEPHTITRTTAVYIPGGFIHSPWTIKKVDRPFIFLQVSHGPHEGGKYYPQLLPKEKRDIMQYYGQH